MACGSQAFFLFPNILGQNSVNVVLLLHCRKCKLGTYGREGYPTDRDREGAEETERPTVRPGAEARGGAEVAITQTWKREEGGETR